MNFPVILNNKNQKMTPPPPPRHQFDPKCSRKRIPFTLENINEISNRKIVRKNNKYIVVKPILRSGSKRKY